MTLTSLLISLHPSALCPVVGMADCESLRQGSHLLAPTEEICSPAPCPPFLPQMTVIRRPRGAAYEETQTQKRSCYWAWVKLPRKHNPFHLMFTRPDSSSLPHTYSPKYLSILLPLWVHPKLAVTEMTFSWKTPIVVMCALCYFGSSRHLDRVTRGLFSVPKASFSCRMPLLPLHSPSLSLWGGHNLSCIKVTTKGGRGQLSQVPEEDIPAFLPL